MPSKSHRAASRQAKLRQKKRRGKGGTQLFDAGPTESSAEAATEGPIAEAAVEPEPQTAPSPAAVASPPAQPTRRPRRSHAAEVAPRYEHLASELRRIGTVTLVILVVLVALSFILGGR